jgi:murein peptide amidase A
MKNILRHAGAQNLRLARHKETLQTGETTLLNGRTGGANGPNRSAVEIGSSASHRRSLADLLAPLEQLAANSTSLVANRGARFESGGEVFELPRYIFVGPQGGDSPIRIGLFAALHGDEPEGAHALVELAKLLEAQPQLAAGYSLSLYPVCNPSGFEDNTAASRAGKDLSREFWSNSTEPEVQILQAELVTRSFHGIISLRTDSAAGGLYGLVRGSTLSEHLLEPALQAAEAILPHDRREEIAGFDARDGILRDWHEGDLSAPPRVRLRPFEIILATPQSAPLYVRQLAFVAALRTILTEYRKFISYATNL